MTLIMTDINSPDLIAVGILRIPIDRSPAESVGSDKEIIKQPYVKANAR